MSKKKKQSHLIDRITISKIEEAAKIEEVVSDYVTLYREGAGFSGLCPFHDDKHLGSFKVSPAKNVCTCFACRKSYNPVSFVMEIEGEAYPQALRRLAAKYSITIDDSVPAVKQSTYKPQPVMQLPVHYFPIDFVREKLPNHGTNALINYLRSLPWGQDNLEYLELVLGVYGVGTMTDQLHQGWTIFWQIDQENRVRDGKVMQYTEDGHRNKANKYSITWISSMLKPFGMFDPEKERIERCLFGLHLVRCYPDATVYVVESEKTAILCSTRGDMTRALFLATAGKGNLTRQMLQPLIDEHRYIRLMPDRDGREDWVKLAKGIEYDRISVISDELMTLTSKDGDHADQADIIIRELHEEAERRTSEPLEVLKQQNPLFENLCNQLQLTCERIDRMTK